MEAAEHLLQSFLNEKTNEINLIYFSFLTLVE